MKTTPLIRPFLDRPKGGFNKGILLYTCTFRSYLREKRLQGMDAHVRETTLSKCIVFFVNKSPLWNERLCSNAAKCFLLDQVPFQKGLYAEESKQKVKRLSPLLRSQNIDQVYPFPLIYSLHLYEYSCKVYRQDIFSYIHVRLSSKWFIW